MAVHKQHNNSRQDAKIAKKKYHLPLNQYDFNFAIFASWRQGRRQGTCTGAEAPEQATIIVVKIISLYFACSASCLQDVGKGREQERKLCESQVIMDGY